MVKSQWGFILALIIALLIAIFSVINVEPVSVNYLFGKAEWPLILVILGSVLMGGLIVGSIGIVRVFQLQRTVRNLTKHLHQDDGSHLSEAQSSHDVEQGEGEDITEPLKDK